MSKLATPVGPQDHTQGAENAAVTLVEYGDYQCPSCGEAFHIIKRVQTHFGDRLRFVFRNFPLEMHPFAEAAAETAEFAAAQGKFWEMHDALFHAQKRMTADLFPKLATELGLDATALGKALDAQSFEERVQEDLESGEDSDVQGTPTFYINAKEFKGSYDADTLIQAIEAAAGK